MKSLFKISFILLLVTQSLLAQYNINSGTPVNMMPVMFHQNHLFLKGKLKRLVVYFKGEKAKEYIFNEKGFITFYYQKFNDFEFEEHEYIYRDDQLFALKRNIIKKLSSTFRVDDQNRPVKRIYDGVIDQYEYDPDGNLIKLYTDYQSDTLYLSDAFTYDKSGRMTEWRNYKPDGKLNHATSYFYEQEGDFLKITKTTAGQSRVTYYLNGFNCGDKPVKIEFDQYGNPLSNGRDVTYRYVYDTDNQITTPNNTHCLSGDCQNGWGTRQYENGTYTGFFENGLRQGFGHFSWKNGQSYEGMWQNDRTTGLGVYVLNNKEIKQGEFKDGKLNGLGIYNDKDTWERGVYDNGNLITPYLISENGNTTGCVAGDCQNKYGKYIFDNGEFFAGFWKDGKMYLGHYFFSREDFYFGYFNTANQFDQYGFFQQSGQLYSGEWKDGKMHGKGYFEYKDGTKRIGIWENGKFVKSLK